MKVNDLTEKQRSQSQRSKESCWSGYRKVGTKPSPTHGKSVRVNDCEKIKENELDPANTGEYDREGEMAKQNLTTAADAANELRSILDSDENLPEWVQAKITKAVDYLDTARDYMKSKEPSEPQESLTPAGQMQTLKQRLSQVGEGIDANQRRARQVPGEEMPKSTGPILGKQPKQHPFKGRAVGGGI